jgi:hypothetical protein
VDNLNSGGLITNFYEWLFVGMTNPWNAKVVFADTANNQSIGADDFQGFATIAPYTNGLFLLKNAHLAAGRYSSNAQALANRAVSVSTVPVIYPGEFIDYVTIASSNVVVSSVTSKVVQYGGAAFWDSTDQSTGALMGVYNNGHITRQDHYHVSDFNGLYLTGYGEQLLSNVGVGSTIGGTILGFPGTFYENSGRDGNVVLIGNRNYAQDQAQINKRDNSYYNWNPFNTGNPPESPYVSNGESIPLYGGDGIQESILATGFDYAQGIATSPYVFRSTTDGAVTVRLGEDQRSFIFVHPSTTAPKSPGYWIVADDIVTSTQPSVNVLWHPYGTIAGTTTASTEWNWLVSTRAGVTSTYLNLYAATPPSSVSFSSSPFSANPNSFTGSYLNASYAVDSSSNARVLTVLYPSNPTHTKATMARLAPSGATGVTVTTGTVVDHILISSPSTTVTIATGTYSGRVGYARLVSDIISSFFVRQGTSFNDGGTNRIGFNSDARISLYMKGVTGEISVSTATNVDFYYPGITGVQLEGTPVIGVDGTNVYSIDVASGCYTVTFSSTTPDAPGCSCGGWTSGACGVGGCASSEIYQTRVCSPAACDSETQCIFDASCTPPEPPPPSNPSHAGMKGRLKVKGSMRWK